jgi:MoxR-like ATPase
VSDYRKIFDPPLIPPQAPAGSGQLADRAEHEAYVYDEDLVLAINVALATSRPLLLRGRPGTGKSSVARDVARVLRRRFYPRTISSRTQARDLLWTVDDVARLSDASAGRVRERASYVVPGVLWWAFSPSTAATRDLPAGPPRSERPRSERPQSGWPRSERPQSERPLPGRPQSGRPLPGLPPPPDPNEGVAGAAAAVVLLDEIDKADPDVPNDLLEPLGMYQFRTERGTLVAAGGAAPLVVLTTNEERSLPRAFLRRCVVHVLPRPTRRRLLDIARVRLGPDDGLYGEVVRALAGTAADDEQVDVSIAEFLDAVAAARDLGIRPDHALWHSVLAATTEKPTTIDLR